MRSMFLSLGLGLVLWPAVVAAQGGIVPPRLTLSEALRLAEERSARLAAAEHGVAMAEADVRDARRRPNPALSVEGEAYPLFERPLTSFWNNQGLTFRVDQEFETAGRRGLRIEVANTGVDFARASVEDERRRLQLDVARAYFQVALAQAADEVAATALDELDRVIGLTDARFAAGEVAGTELRRLQVERLRFVDDVLAAELAARNARADLLGLLNMPDLRQSFEAVDPLPAPPLRAPDGDVVATAAGLAVGLPALRARALANRPDLRQVHLAQSRAETETRRQRALRTPNITAGWGYRRHFGTNRMEFGLTVPLPLFNSLNPGGVRRAEAARGQADALAELAATGVDVELQQAVNAVEISAERARYVEQEYLLNARESVDIIQASYELGAADLIDFLDAQRAFRETQQVRNRALYELRVSLAELATVVGLSPAGPGETF